MAQNFQSVEFIAKLLEISDRRVQQLAAQGYIPRAERGQYDLVPAIRGYIRYLKEASGGGEESDAISFTKHRARLTKERANLAEIERRTLEKELIPAAQIKAAWSAVVATMRARILNIPAKVAPRLLAPKNVAEIQAIIRLEAEAALEDIANTEVEIEDPADGPSDSGGDRARGVRDMPPTAKADRRQVG